MIVAATEESIDAAATLLRAGSLIGMPTETVYGIAADALNPDAVRATFGLKGRPAENPLIVHVASIEQARGLSTEFSDDATKLARAFWPGPLTLVLTKSLAVPDEVTAGLDTVALRMPNHPVARRLIELAGTPVSAPSANTFMGLSPTSAQMIAPEIASGLAMILDGGPCEVGIESTVVDLTSDRPAILRPGRVTAHEIEGALGKQVQTTLASARKSPGMYPRHYAPRAKVVIVDRLSAEQPGLTICPAAPGQIQMPGSSDEYAAELYRSLHELDTRGVDTIYVQAPPRTADWEAVWDRLGKASTSESGC